MSGLKQHLHDLCRDYIAKREAETKAAIAEAQEAANNETKSTAGDKYETVREMMQQDINMNLARLNELHKLKAALQQIPATQGDVKVLPGSVVYTSNGNYYIAISAGKLQVDGTTYYAISPSSPIGMKMMTLQAGDSFELSGKKFVIDQVE